MAILPEPKPEHKTQQTDKDAGEHVDLNLQVRLRKKRVEHKTEGKGRRRTVEGKIPKYYKRKTWHWGKKSEPEGNDTRIEMELGSYGALLVRLWKQPITSIVYRPYISCHSASQVSRMFPKGPSPTKKTHFFCASYSRFSEWKSGRIRLTSPHFTFTSRGKKKQNRRSTWYNGKYHKGDLGMFCRSSQEEEEAAGGVPLKIS